MATDATPREVGLTEGLGLDPEIPRRWYCNKCGHYGEEGPEHNVCAGYPEQQCQYRAISQGPYWNETQVRKLLAAERERCAAMLREAAAKLTPPGKRANQVDMHVAHVLERKAEELMLGPNVRGNADPTAPRTPE